MIDVKQWLHSEEKREPVSDIDTVVADSLKVLDLKRPIREADITVPMSTALAASLSGRSAASWAMTDRPQKITFAEMRDMGVFGC